MTIKAVFFDLFNTLAYYYPTREERHAEAIRQFGFAVNAETVRQAYVEGEHFWTLENGRFPLSKRTREEMQEFYADYEIHLLTAAGVIVTPQEAIKIYRTYRTLAASLVLYDDVIPTLANLKEKQLKLGLISNIAEDVVPVCEQLGVAHHLDFMLGSSTAGFEKPDTRIFTLALEKAGIEAREAIHVGDQYHSDIIGARQSGILPVLLDRHGLLVDFADCIRIKTLAEVATYI